MNKYLTREIKNLIMYCILSVITYIELIFIFMIYSDIAKVVENKDISEMKKNIIYILVVFFSIYIFMIVTAFVKRRILNNISYKLRKDIFYKLYKKEEKKFRENRKIYYKSILIEDVFILEKNYFEKKLELIASVVQLIIFMGAITYVNWKYTFIILAIVFTLYFFYEYFFKKITDKVIIELKEYSRKYVMLTKEHTRGFETIRGLGKRSVFRHIFYKNVVSLEKTNTKLNNMETLNSSMLLMGGNLMRIAVMAIISNDVLAGNLNVVLVCILYGLILNIFNPMLDILKNVKSINETEEIRNKVMKFIKENDEELENDINVKFDEIDFIEMNDVEYIKEGKNILNKVSMYLEKGNRYALVGDNELEKSTLLNLLYKYIDDYKGEIYVNGTDISCIDKKLLRKNVAYITKDAYVYNDSIENNIRLGIEGYSKDDIDKVVTYVGLNTVRDRINLEIGGINDIRELACCEKHKIDFARALIREPKWMIVDEGTCELDKSNMNNIEKIILESDDITAIIALNKINETIKFYDKIFYLKNGKIVEIGNYYELVNMQGEFVNYLRGRV